MKAILIRTLVGCLLACCPAAWAAGGSSGSTARPTGPTPQQRAAQEYEAGLRHRDKAWAYEEKAAAADKEKDQKKNIEKARNAFEKAAKSQRKAVELDPSMHQAHSSLGYALRRLERFAEALAAYDRALELEPDYVEAIEYRAEAYLGLGRYAETQKAYAALRAKNPRYALQLLEAMRGWAAAGEDTTQAGAAMRRWVAEQAQEPPADTEGKAW